MVFGREFEIDLNHEHFPEALEKVMVFLSLLSFSVLVMRLSMERLYPAKFTATFYGV